ncbi:MAG TPA: cytochrome P450 [Pseudonocardia sp.]|jgi:cytochrome P450|nr:cytochrome P450 [Pseudonocardia sp.]
MTQTLQSQNLQALHLSELDFWRETGHRDEVFARLRAQAPVSWQPGNDWVGQGFWALTRHRDIVTVTRDTATFSSVNSILMLDKPDVPPERKVFESMINADDPKHVRLRRLVAQGFTPRRVRELDDSVRRRSREIVDRIAARGECEFVEEVAAALPLAVICDMMGLPGTVYKRVFDLTNIVLGVGDPEYGVDLTGPYDAGWELHHLALDHCRARLADAGDDLTSVLVHGEIEGERLTIDEVATFFTLLVIAGNETTRNAISHGLLALTAFPDQRRLWMDRWDEVTPTAVDEIVRWATPVIHMRRRALADAVVGGVEIAAGDKVVMFYSSANRDEDVFDEPHRFDLTRTPNHHLAFGAQGPHYCLGAHLARREISLMFEELFRRVPDIELDGEPTMLWSPFLHGVKRLPARFTPS